MSSRDAARASRRGAAGLALALAVALLLALGARALARAALDERARWPRGADHAVLLPPPEAAPLLFAGYRELAADITWARTLVYFGSSFLGEADYRYLERYIDTILALDPRFERVYRWAALVVTHRDKIATPDEFRLSLKYLEQAMERFPDKHEFFLLAGQRYFLDLTSDDPAEQRRFRERGAALIEQAVRKKDAPRDLATFAATLRTRLGQKERALHDLREMILITESEEARQRLLERYAQLAGEDFPDEARRARDELERGWKRELGFESPSMYIIMGDRPPGYIDFGKLAMDRDLFGVEDDAAAP